MAQTKFDREDADDFLDKVDDITKRVEDILAGKVDVIEEEERFVEEQKIREVKKDIANREFLEKIAKGVPGRGYKGNFKTFCKGCHTEYHHEAVEICNNCGRETVTYEVSKTEQCPPWKIQYDLCLGSFLEVSRKFLQQFDD